MDALKLCQLTCSRLCHDLITPVGALASGLEIISESPEGIDDELLSLTNQSAQNAIGRLTYYRAAFGFAGVALFGSPEKIFELLRKFLQTSQIELQWDHQGLAVFAESLSRYGRFILNTVGVIVETAPFGGRLHLQVTPKEVKDKFDFSFTLEGNLVMLKPEIRACLLGTLSEENITPHTVQAHLTKQYLEQADLFIEDLNSDKQQCVLNAVACAQKESAASGSLF